ncbi:hypothetical protein BH09SUM1_BH09SUM1_01010 [soil metagenome]
MGYAYRHRKSEESANKSKKISLTQSGPLGSKLYTIKPKGAFLTMNYKKLILDAFPHAFLQDVVTLLFEVYRKAHAATIEEFPSQLVATRCGMERYFMLERDLPKLAKKHGLAMNFQPNANGGWNHMEIGNTDIVLTQKKVRDPEELVPKAIFRETLAEGNEEQLTLFSTEEPITPAAIAAERRVFVMLLHGYADGQRERPSFAHLVVPNQGCTTYLARLDLFAHCHAQALEAGSDLEVIVPTAAPTIKKKAEEGTNS